MVEIVLDVADPKSGKTYHVKLGDEASSHLIGRRIGEVIAGDPLGLEGYKLKITGGTDVDGFPMHPSVHGTRKVRVILSGPPGFHPTRKGERKSKLVRGNIISDATKQVNMVVVEYGKVPLEQLFGEKEGEEESG